MSTDNRRSTLIPPTHPMRFAKSIWRRRIRAGDVVTLRSGGTAMTAIQVGRVVFAEGRWVTCQWFEGEQLKQEMFHEASLQRLLAQAS